MSHQSFFAEATRRSGRHSSSPMAIDRLDRKSGDVGPKKRGRGKRHSAPITTDLRAGRGGIGGQRVEPAVASPPSTPHPDREFAERSFPTFFSCIFLSPDPVPTSGSKITNFRTRCIYFFQFLRYPIDRWPLNHLEAAPEAAAIDDLGKPKLPPSAGRHLGDRCGPCRARTRFGPTRSARGACRIMAIQCHSVPQSAQAQPLGGGRAQRRAVADHPGGSLRPSESVTSPPMIEWRSPRCRDFLSTGGEIDQVVERRPEWSMHEDHYDLRPVLEGRRLFVATRLIDSNPDDPDDPRISIANIPDA